jgi:hypothetical protein
MLEDQGVVDILHFHQTGGQGNRLTNQTIWIPSAIPVLMMVMGSFPGKV